MNKLLDIKDRKGYTLEYLEWKKISLHIIKRYPLISMMISIQRYPFISMIHILWLIRIKGYLRISKEKWGYLRISFWGELPDARRYTAGVTVVTLSASPTHVPGHGLVLLLRARLHSPTSPQDHVPGWWHARSGSAVTSRFSGHVPMLSPGCHVPTLPHAPRSRSLLPPFLVPRVTIWELAPYGYDGFI